MTLDGRKLLALIPARGGSKGVPRKNLRIIGNKPLLSHTIDAARQVAAIDTVYVSSDDSEILELAKQNNVIPIQRASEAASDTATASDVLADFTRGLDSSLKKEDPIVIYLQPTSPLRNCLHIEEALRIMRNKQSWQCISVEEMHKTPYKAFKRDAQGNLVSLFDSHLAHVNRQSLETLYYPNGAIYIFPLSAFLEKREFPSNGSVAYVMSEHESLDIDTSEDFKRLDALWPMS